ncbi:hypothetical protein [Streptomyces griseoruber]|uniref:hypothetical protein n=1 Tax=Streptomyces griseoruber TaxID=1943 RepID=UPI003791B8A8
MTDQFAQSSAVLLFALGAAAVAEARSLHSKFGAESSGKEDSEPTATAPARQPQQNNAAQPKKKSEIIRRTAIAIVGLVWLALVLYLIQAEIVCLRWLANKPRTTDEEDALFILRTITAGIWLLLAPPALMAYATAHAAATSGKGGKYLLRERAKQRFKKS